MTIEPIAAALSASVILMIVIIALAAVFVVLTIYGRKQEKKYAETQRQVSRNLSWTVSRNRQKEPRYTSSKRRSARRFSRSCAVRKYSTWLRRDSPYEL